jgi:O-acetyl-ADP-ribose deacetylase (regulator of RNase III)
MGLRDLIKIIKENNIKSIAVPGLGCGNGQLNWSDVKPLMEKHFEELQDVEIEIYEPKVKSWGRPKIKK